MNNNLVYILTNQSFYSEYQPIVDISKDEIYGYEALARFEVKGKSISPMEIFDICHDGDYDKLFVLESLLKKYQVENRPDSDKKLFLNLDAHSFNTYYGKEFWLNFFKDLDNIVVEIVENSEVYNNVHIDRFIDFLDMYFIDFAIDDFCKDDSIFSTKILSKSRIVKLDKGFLRSIERDKAYKEVLKGYLNYFNASNKMAILEGVESSRDLELAKELGIKYVQGFYYKDRFIVK
jgi:EAL domain-containing protein (putative c-di-GMP-specific phosphodiesterase class I)